MLSGCEARGFVWSIDDELPARWGELFTESSPQLFECLLRGAAHGWVRTREGLFAMRSRFCRFPLAQENQSQSEVRIIGVGIKFDGDQELAFSVFKLLLGSEQVSQAAMRLREIRFQPDGHAVFVSRLVGVSLWGQNVSKVAMSLGIVRVNRDGSPQLGHRPIVGMSRRQDLSIAMVSLGILGVEGDRSLEVVPSLGIVAVSRQYVAEVIVRVGKVGAGFGWRPESVLRPLPRCPSRRPVSREGSAPVAARD